MPSQPLPATGAGNLVMNSRHEGTHLRAILFRRAATGAWVQIGEVRISYPIVQAAMAKVEGTPGPTELGFVSDVDELGRLGDRIKKVAKTIAKSKLIKGVAKLGKVATAFVPGGNLIRTAVKAGKGLAAVAKGAARGGLKGALRGGTKFALSGEAPSGGDIWAPDFLGAVASPPKKLPAKKPAPKPIVGKVPVRPAAPAKKHPPAKKPAPSAKKPAPAAKTAALTTKKPAPPKKPAPAKKPAKPTAAKKPARKPTPAKKPAPKGKSPVAASTAARTVPPATVAKVEALTAQIADTAPQLAEVIQQLPDIPPEQRGLVEERAKEAARVLAAAPAEERPALAEKIETRIDSYKVIAPNGDVVWVPRADAEG